MPRSAFLLLVALVAPLVAGCAAQEGPAQDATPQATATTGILHGIVVDEAIRPLSNASVRLNLADGSELATSSDADGGWAFGDLPAGAYFLRTSKLGFFTSQVSANVTAGVPDPERVRIVLLVDPVNLPAVDAYAFDGFLQCSVTLVAARAALCNPSQAAGPLCTLPVNVCTAGPENLTDDRFLAIHDISRPGLAFLQSEMQWTPGSGLGENLKAIPGSRDPATGEINDFRPFEGPSPLVMPMDGDVANALFLGNGKEYTLRVFSGYVDGTAPPCLPSPAGCQWGVGLAFNQRFTILTHAFYGFTPPADWQFGRDGLPPVPQ